MSNSQKNKASGQEAILAEILQEAVHEALDAGCAVIQRRLGVSTGDLAGMYFSGGASRDQVAQAFEEYMRAEIDDGAAPVESSPPPPERNREG